MKEGWLERRNGESEEIKRWRAQPDPKVPFQGEPDYLRPLASKTGGRLERAGRSLDDQALLQWRENKVGLALAAVFVVACLLAVGW